MTTALSSRRALLLPGAWAGNPLWRIARLKPTLDLQFADKKSLVDAISGQNLITFTRASSGTYVDSAGLVKTAATDEARFTHDPATGTGLGLLREEQRTNLLLWSRDLTQSAWVKTNITPALDQVGADGTANAASSITATAGNGTVLQAVTNASAARATTAYVKRLSGSGTIQMTQDGGTTWTAITVTSSWARVAVPSATVTNPSMGFRIVTSGDSIAVDYNQCETGSFATSPIPTTTAAVTRSADVVSISGSNFTGWYNATEGTVFADFRVGYSENFANYPHVYNLNSGSNANAIRILGTVGSRAIIPNVIASSVQYLDYVEVTASSAGNVTAHAFAANSSQLASRGSLIGATDTSVTMPTGINRLNIGMDESNSQPYTGTIARLVYWPKRLSNSILQALTA